MNNAKMWLVVSPTIGVPLFLGAVAVGSFSVHMQVVKNTSWVKDFLQGVPMGTGDKVAAAAALDQKNLEKAKVTYVVPNGETNTVTIIMPDGTSATGTLSMPETLASHSGDQIPPLLTQ